MKDYNVRLVKVNEELMFEVEHHGKTEHLSVKFDAMNTPIMSMRDALSESLEKPMQVVNFQDIEHGNEYSVLAAFDINSDGDNFISIYSFNDNSIQTMHNIFKKCEYRSCCEGVVSCDRFQKCNEKCKYQDSYDGKRLCDVIYSVACDWLKKYLA